MIVVNTVTAATIPFEGRRAKAAQQVLRGVIIPDLRGKYRTVDFEDTAAAQRHKWRHRVAASRIVDVDSANCTAGN